MNGNFTMILHSFLHEKRLSATEKLVFACIKAYAFDGECFPSIKRIALDACVSSRTVQRCIKRLEETGFITVERRRAENGGNMTNLYIINETETENTENKSPEEQSLEKVAESKVLSPFEFKGSDKLLRSLGVSDTEKYRRIYRRLARLGFENGNGVCVT